VILWETHRQRAEAYRNLFTGPTGEKVLADLKHAVGYDRSTFHPDPYISANNEGKRSVIVAIINTMEQAELPEAPAEESEDQDA
jgi:hypothetical protein